MNSARQKYLQKVSAIFFKEFKEINGFSNEYWGWGAEDDDLSNRVRAFYKLKRVPRPYDKMDDYHVVQIKHARDQGNQKNPKAVKLLKKWKSRWPTDGLNVCPVYNQSA